MRLLTFALLALLVTGCDDDPPSGGPSDYYLVITVTPAAVVIPRGGSDVLQIVVTRGAFYPGAITLTAEGLPAGVVATFNPPILNGTDQSTLTLTAPAQATPGPCPFIIRASGPDVEDDVTPSISCVGQ